MKDKERLGNHACDMFAIGSVFHLLLTGELLFTAASSAEVFAKNKKMDFDLSHEKYRKIRNFLAIDNGLETKHLHKCFRKLNKNVKSVVLRKYLS